MNKDIIDRLDKIIALMTDLNAKTVLNYYRKQEESLDKEIEAAEQARIPHEDTAANLIGALIEEDTLESEAIKMYMDQHKEMGIKTPYIRKTDLNRIIRLSHPDFELRNTTRKGVQIRVWKSITNKHSYRKKKKTIKQQIKELKS